MTRRAALLASLLLAACGPAQQASDAPTPTATAAEPARPSPSPGASPRDYAPPVLTPEAERSEKGARNLLLAWAAAMEDRAFAAAYGLFGDYAERTGLSAEQYAASFGPYRTVTVAIGEGAGEGAAGSIYYQAPVTLSGTLADGSAYRRTGTITLRRINDVDGATPAQLRWHLDGIAWDA